jgi:hypothetical protein
MAWNIGCKWGTGFFPRKTLWEKVDGTGNTSILGGIGGCMGRGGWYFDKMGNVNE